MRQNCVCVAFFIVTLNIEEAEFAQKPVLLQIIDEDDLVNLNQPQKSLDVKTLLELLKKDKKIFPRVINLKQPLPANINNQISINYANVDSTEDLTRAAPSKRDIDKLQSIINDVLIRIENDDEKRMSTKSREKRERTRDNKKARATLRANKTRILKILNGLVHEVHDKKKKRLSLKRNNTAGLLRKPLIGANKTNILKILNGLVPELNENKKKKRLSLKRNKTAELLRKPHNDINIIYLSDNINDNDYSDTYKDIHEKSMPTKQKYVFNEINYRYPVNGKNKNNPRQIVNNKKQWQDIRKQYEDDTDTEYRQDSDYKRSYVHDSTGEYNDHIYEHYRDERNNFRNKDEKRDGPQRYKSILRSGSRRPGPRDLPWWKKTKGLQKLQRNSDQTETKTLHNYTNECYESQSDEIMLALENFIESSEKMTSTLKDEIRNKLEKDEGFELKFKEWKKDLKRQLKVTLQGQLKKLNRKPWGNYRNVYMVPVDGCPPPLILFEGRCTELPPHK